jgi:GTP-binding protein
LPEIVFSGRSNVGKSSLLNRLLNRKCLARVSAAPGKTATINFYRGGEPPLRLCDLPGYGFARVPQAEKKRWAGLMEGYFGTERHIRLVVALVDARHPLSAKDLDMLTFLRESGMAFVAVATKCDKLNKTQLAQSLEARTKELEPFGAPRLIAFSALTGLGVDDLRGEILGALGQAV